MGAVAFVVRARNDLRQPWHVAPVRELLARRAEIDKMEPYFPAPRAGLRTVLSRAASGICTSLTISSANMHIFRHIPLLGSSMRAGIAKWSWGASASDPAVKCLRSRATTDICFSISCRSAYPCSESSPQRTLPKPPAARMFRPWSSFSDSALARRLVSEGKRADLIIGNNVLAQVPDLNDFTAGMAILLAAEGVITLEFPHLERLMVENQFDTIYHEHFSYFSLFTIDHLARRHRLQDIRRRAARYSWRIAARLSLSRRKPA